MKCRYTAAVPDVARCAHTWTVPDVATAGLRTYRFAFPRLCKPRNIPLTYCPLARRGPAQRYHAAPPRDVVLPGGTLPRRLCPPRHPGACPFTSSQLPLPVRRWERTVGGTSGPFACWLAPARMITLQPCSTQPSLLTCHSWAISRIPGCDRCAVRFGHVPCHHSLFMVGYLLPLV